MNNSISIYCAACHAVWRAMLCRYYEYDDTSRDYYLYRGLKVQKCFITLSHRGVEKSSTYI